MSAASLIGAAAETNARAMYDVKVPDLQLGLSDSEKKMSSKIRTARHVADVQIPSLQVSAQGSNNPSRAGSAAASAAGSDARQFHPRQQPPPEIQKPNIQSRQVKVAVKILPAKNGEAMSVETLASMLLKGANDPQSTMRNTPGLQGITGAFAIPPGKTLADYYAQTKTQNQSAEKDRKGMSASKVKIRTARGVTDMNGPGGAQGESVPWLQKEPSFKNNGASVFDDVNGAAGGSRRRDDGWSQVRSAPGGELPEGFMTEAQKKAWSEQGGLLGPQQDGKSMKMKIRTARNIVDTQASDKSASMDSNAKPPWAADSFGAEDRAGVDQHSEEAEIENEFHVEERYVQGGQNVHFLGQDQARIVTRMDNPDLPQGWVEVTEPGGRKYFAPELHKGVDLNLLKEEKVHEERDEISESSASDDDGGESEYSEEGEPLALTRLSTMFMQDLEFDEEIKVQNAVND